MHKCVYTFCAQDNGHICAGCVFKEVEIDDLRQQLAQKEQELQAEKQQKEALLAKSENAQHKIKGRAPPRKAAAPLRSPASVKVPVAAAGIKPATKAFKIAGEKKCKTYRCVHDKRKVLGRVP